MAEQYDNDQIRRMFKAEGQDVNKMMEEGKQTLMDKGFWYALTARDLTAKAAVISALCGSLEHSLEATRKHPEHIHMAVHLPKDEQGDQVVIGACTPVGGRLLEKMIELVNGIPVEAAEGILETFEMLNALGTPAQEVWMDQVLKDILDKADNEGQDGPNASK